MRLAVAIVARDGMLRLVELAEGWRSALLAAHHHRRGLYAGERLYVVESTALLVHWAGGEAPRYARGAQRRRAALSARRYGERVDAMAARGPAPERLHDLYTEGHR